MPDANIHLHAPEGLVVDPRSATWLLDRPHPAPEFYRRGMPTLIALDDQAHHDRIVAEADFQSGSERYFAVAVLSRPERGLHRLLALAIRRDGDRWPTLCSDLALDLGASSTID